MARSLDQGAGRHFIEQRFGDSGHATYWVATGDVDLDGFPDIAVADSGARNGLFLNRGGGHP